MCAANGSEVTVYGPRPAVSGQIYIIPNTQLSNKYVTFSFQKKKSIDHSLNQLLSK